MIKIFISSQYRNDGAITDEAQIESNIKNQMCIANRIIVRGYNPFIPLLYHFQNENYPKDEAVWREIDKDWLAVCDCVFRDKSISKGADEEVRYAESINKPVYYTLEEMFTALEQDDG